MYRCVERYCGNIDRNRRSIQAFQAGKVERDWSDVGTVLRLFKSKASKLHITQLCWPCTIMYLRKRRALVKIYKQARWHQNDVTWHIYRDEVFRDKRGEQVAFQHSNDDVEVESRDEAVTIVISLLERLQSVFLVHVLPYTMQHTILFHRIRSNNSF